ncbi:hypothetical protein O6H91_03G125600 [Diphasiastrum complanatum]|uniref:Uncharacterized protein n=1 Tax=Diphasiastrum complanatum TaxID=34168 RepID=A0ACC2EBS0_DIPCM|nr:hypothetical protein O6H91_03G125600 [Diphasiastrum complanatum]
MFCMFWNGLTLFLLSLTFSMEILFSSSQYSLICYLHPYLYHQHDGEDHQYHNQFMRLLAQNAKSLCSSCLSLSPCSCVRDSCFPLSLGFQIVTHKKRSAHLSPLSIVKSPSCFGLPVLGRSRSTSWIESSSKEDLSPPSSHYGAIISDYCRTDPNEGTLNNKPVSSDADSPSTAQLMRLGL